VLWEEGQVVAVAIDRHCGWRGGGGSRWGMLALRCSSKWMKMGTEPFHCELKGVCDVIVIVLSPGLFGGQGGVQTRIGKPPQHFELFRW